MGYLVGSYKKIYFVVEKFCEFLEVAGAAFRSQTYVPSGRLPIGRIYRTTIRRCSVIPVSAPTALAKARAHILGAVAFIWATTC
jgi:hypothetical protein